MTFIRAAEKKRRAYHACGVDVASIYNKNICSYMCVVYMRVELSTYLYIGGTVHQCNAASAMPQIKLRFTRVESVIQSCTAQWCQLKKSFPLRSFFFTHTSGHNINYTLAHLNAYVCLCVCAI